ncbi:hypothetical protein [Gelidibacter maritimus]|uniref:Uncharacterized protein n=1 Tax=Gelidibacter maritimus TaxID=2761487 RepID=A0A7W2R585_9FLAO|nr:hypothetical protein [Gelidibacter maritimus]MBA6154676.1 hypothetical protein [Gelidibacter maritimus]
MNKTFTILWIDDEHDHEALEPFIIQAESKGIFLEGYNNFKKGFEVLENDLLRFDGVLLDALFFFDENSETPNTKGLGAALGKLNELKNKKLLPYFILSGQSSFTDKQNDILEANDLKCYNKKKISDVKKLLDNIISESEGLDVNQLKHRYPKQFEMCSDNYLGKKHFDRLHHLVLGLENPAQIIIAQDSLNGIRKIIEAVFIKLNEIGCIPDEIIHDQGWINGSGKFLSGRHRDYLHKHEVIHPVVAFNIFKILNVTQDGSHNEGKSLGVDAYMASNKNTFLYQSVVLLLLDTLDYMKTFIDNNADKALNQLKWEAKPSTNSLSNEWIRGEISRIADNNYGTFQPEDGGNTISILPEIIAQYSLTADQIIEVTTKPSRCGTKTFIDEIRLSR